MTILATLPAHKRCLRIKNDFEIRLQLIEKTKKSWFQSFRIKLLNKRKCRNICARNCVYFIVKCLQWWSLWASLRCAETAWTVYETKIHSINRPAYASPHPWALAHCNLFLINFLQIQMFLFVCDTRTHQQWWIICVN